jgi:hypothetical protein
MYVLLQVGKFNYKFKILLSYDNFHEDTLILLSFKNLLFKTF